MQIAICDDNEMFLQELKCQLLSLSMTEETAEGEFLFADKSKFLFTDDDIFLFADIKAFLQSVKNGKVYDAVLMDIDFEADDDTGMDAAGELLKLCPKTKVIYVTGFNDEYSQHIFLKRSNLSGFLTKPVDIELLKANLQKVIDNVPHEEEPSLMLKQGGASVYVPLREIYFIESKGHTVEVHTTTGEVIISYERLENILKSIPAGLGFYQCHKSYIVNMRQIRRFETNQIILKNDKIIPVSRSKYNETKEAYFNFIGHSF